MTEKEIKKLRRENPRFNGGWLTKEQEQLHKELDCRQMINSCLCYWTDFINSRYSDSYIEELWEKKVVELYYEQLKDFEKAEVLYNVYEDWEWCTYNSIKRADD